MQSLDNIWLCAREILWLACPRPSGKLLTLIKATIASSLKKYKLHDICMLALIVKIRKKKIPTNAPYKVVAIKELER